ncbi:MAG: hypothetical protein ACLRUM_04340 [Veillonella parvula]
MERVRLVHGNGGRFSHELTDRFILKYFTNDLLAPLHDGAQFPVTAGRMAFSTDSLCGAILRSFLVVILASWLFVEL